ncbi:MAG TPA: hypothetical protein VF032_02375 [Thermoleophilaceae bacterium]
MAKSKKKNDRIKLVLQRMIEDEDVQGQFRTGATRLHEAWQRASSKRPSRAVEDKKVYEKVREGATSLTKAIRSAGRPPEPPPRRGLKLALVVATAGGAAYAVKKLQSNGSVS